LQRAERSGIKSGANNLLSLGFQLFLDLPKTLPIKKITAATASTMFHAQIFSSSLIQELPNLSKML